MSRPDIGFSCAAVALLCATVALSCAAPVKVARPVDPLAVLEPGLSAYARLEGEAARRLVPSVLPPEERQSLAPLLERTAVAAIGVSGGQASGGTIAGGGSGAPLLEAVLVGDFPFRGALFALASNRAWRRDGKAYYHEAAGIRAMVPAAGLVLASTGSPEALLSRAMEPRASPLPARLEALAGRELVLWLPDPFARLRGDGEEVDIPSRGLLIAASAESAAKGFDGKTGGGAEGSPGGGRRYLATIAFLMDDADQARIFRPALRLGWYLVARGLLGEEAGPALGARFELDGDLVYASSVELPEEALARALSAAVPSTYRSLNAPPAP